MRIRKYTPTGKWGKPFCDGAAEVMSGSPMREFGRNEREMSNRIERVTMRTQDGYIVDLTRDELEAAIGFCNRVDPQYANGRPNYGPAMRLGDDNVRDSK